MAFPFFWNSGEEHQEQMPGVEFSVFIKTKLWLVW